MSFKLQYMSPAPWRGGSPRWNVIDAHGRLVAEVVKRFNGDKDVGDAHLDFILLARNAFDVMMRRGWNPYYAADDGWRVEDGGCGGRTTAEVNIGGKSWPDPFTALVEADRWYRENVEHAEVG
jgi:hypothetical protein